MGFLKWITGGHAQRGHHGGAPLRQLACAGCGALNDAQARFCPACGTQTA